MLSQGNMNKRWFCHGKGNDHDISQMFTGMSMSNTYDQAWVAQLLLNALHNFVNKRAQTGSSSPELKLVFSKLIWKKIKVRLFYIIRSVYFFSKATF